MFTIHVHLIAMMRSVWLQYDIFCFWNYTYCILGLAFCLWSAAEFRVALYKFKLYV